MQQCKYKTLQKPNHWRIMLFLELKKQSIENQNSNLVKPKTSYSIDEISKEINMAHSHIRHYLNELEEQGLVNMIKIKGRLQVLL